MAKEKNKVRVLELKDPRVYKSGAIVKTLYINGAPSSFNFNCDHKIRGALGGWDKFDLFYAVKDIRTLDFLPYAHFDLKTPPELADKLLFGQMTFIDFIRYGSAFEVGLNIYFPFEKSSTSAVNPLRLINDAIAQAQSLGFSRTDFLGTKEKPEWSCMHSAIFYYRSRCNEQTAMQKTEEAIVVFNKLLHKVATEQYLHLKQSLEE